MIMLRSPKGKAVSDSGDWSAKEGKEGFGNHYSLHLQDELLCIGPFRYKKRKHIGI
jgi:hypothetical protein